MSLDTRIGSIGSSLGSHELDGLENESGVNDDAMDSIRGSDGGDI